MVKTQPKPPPKPRPAMRLPVARRVQVRSPRGHPQTAPQPPAERLSKRVAEQVPCSRSQAEQYIEGGWVMVDGQVVEEPMFRVSHQTVTLDPHANLMELAAVTLLLHKPPGFDAIAALGEANQRVKPAQQLLKPEARFADDASGTRILKRHFSKLLATVPLESAASGLVVFTQDWRVARKLQDDAHLMEQELIVEVTGEVAADVIHRLNQGMSSDGQPLPPVKVSLNSTGDASSKLRFAIKGFHPGLIAYLCERVGLHIIGMKRLRVGRVAMAQLPQGQWRYLQAHERF